MEERIWNDAQQERRWATVGIGADLLFEVLCGRVTIGGFPPDAKVRRVGYIVQSDEIELLLEHPSFQPVEPRCYAPHLSVCYQRRTLPEAEASHEEARDLA